MSPSHHLLLMSITTNDHNTTSPSNPGVKTTGRGFSSTGPGLRLAGMALRKGIVSVAGQEVKVSLGDSGFGQRGWCLLRGATC